MIVIAVDDEELMLRALVRTISASPDVREIIKFSNTENALDYVKENPIDVAFLDINIFSNALLSKLISCMLLCAISTS